MQVFTAQTAEVGFTNNGPIFNVRMVFCADRLDAIFDNVEIVLRHEDGETKTLRWAGLGDNMGEAVDAAGDRQTFTRDLAPIAVKIPTTVPLEKFVRFQEPAYHDTKRKYIEVAIAHFNYLRLNAEPEVYVPQSLASREFLELLEARKSAFWWKPGRYSATVRPSSPSRFDLLQPEFVFSLAPTDIVHLKRNLRVLDADLRNLVNSNLKEYEAEPIQWQWVFPSLSRSSLGHPRRPVPGSSTSTAE